MYFLPPDVLSEDQQFFDQRVATLQAQQEEHVRQQLDGPPSPIEELTRETKVLRLSERLATLPVTRAAKRARNRAEDELEIHQNLFRGKKCPWRTAGGQLIQHIYIC